MTLRPLSALLCVSVAATHAFGSSDLAAGLQRVAEAATVMIDGDRCLRIPTARSQKYAAVQDPRDPWRASDNYNVNAQAFIEVKKTLIRLSQLCPLDCDVNLWMPLQEHPDRIEIVIRNVHELSQFWTWGALNQPMPPAMKRVLTTGQPSTIQQKPGMVSVLAPIRNSMGDVVAIAEVVSQYHQDPRENVK